MSENNRSSSAGFGILLAALSLASYDVDGRGDGEKIDGKDAIFTPSAQLASATQLRILNLVVPQIYHRLGTDSFGHPAFLSAPVSFTLPFNTVSFQISLRHGETDLVCLDRVDDPDNLDVTVQGDQNVVWTEQDYCSVLVPQAPEFVAKSGRWRYSVSARVGAPRDVSVTLALRTGALPSNASTLRVQPFLASGTSSAADIQPALDEMHRIYEQVGIALQIADTIVVSEPAFRLVNPDFTDPITARLIGLGLAGSANIFFVDDSSTPDSSLLGVAAGIAGSLGIAGSRNGVLVGLNGHLIANDQLDTNLLGETAGHEMGHFLGLSHTTEMAGWLHDPLDDTAECDVTTRDANGDAKVSAEECLGVGASNLMFWTPGTGIRQTEVTPNQAHVIHFSPIADIN